MDKLQPILLPPAREKVASELRKAILSRRFEEGEELVLENIAALLGVSTTPVREAFQILARDRLIELRPNKRAVVLGMTERYIRDHYQLRIILETAACEIICEKNKELEPLIELFHRSEKEVENKNFDVYSDLNNSFHYALWNITGNKKLVTSLSELWNGLPFRKKVTEEEAVKISLEEHRGILEALKKRESKKAKKLMEEHLDRSLENILSNYIEENI